MTIKDNESFESTTKCRIFDNNFVENCVKVRYSCHVTGKCRGAAQGDWNINVSV